MIKSNGAKSSLVSNYRGLSIDFQLKCWVCSAMHLAHKGISNPIKLEQSCWSMHYTEYSNNPLGSEQENHFNHKEEKGVICQCLLPCPIIWIWAICVHTVKDIITRFTETDRWVSRSWILCGFITGLFLNYFSVYVVLASMLNRKKRLNSWSWLTDAFGMYQKMFKLIRLPVLSTCIQTKRLIVKKQHQMLQFKFNYKLDRFFSLKSDWPCSKLLCDHNNWILY